MSVDPSARDARTCAVADLPIAPTFQHHSPPPHRRPPPLPPPPRILSLHSHLSSHSVHSLFRVFSLTVSLCRATTAPDATPDDLEAGGSSGPRTRSARNRGMAVVRIEAPRPTSLTLLLLSSSLYPSFARREEGRGKQRQQEQMGLRD